MGRPPIGKARMTNAEKQRRYREKLHEAAKASPKAAEANTRSGSAAKAREIARLKAELEAMRNAKRAAEPEIDLATLSMNARQKFDAAIRQYRRKLDLEFAARVSEEVKRVLDQWLPEYHEKLAEAERILNSYQGIMPRVQFRKILACLHPDRSMSDQKLNEAFNIVEKLEAVLVKKEEQERASSTFQFPRTYEEAMKMKRDLAAARKAKRTGKSGSLQRA
jgi:hypothetical protein